MRFVAAVSMIALATIVLALAPAPRNEYFVTGKVVEMSFKVTFIPEPALSYGDDLVGTTRISAEAPRYVVYIGPNPSAGLHASRRLEVSADEFSRIAERAPYVFKNP